MSPMLQNTVEPLNLDTLGTDEGVFISEMS